MKEGSKQSTYLGEEILGVRRKIKKLPREGTWPGMSRDSEEKSMATVE